MLMLYFSGTGNSKYMANSFSKKTGAHCYSIETNMNFSKEILINDTIGFCYPTYGGCVPRIMREFVAKHTKDLKGKKLIIFCTQLMFSGDGARAFIDLLPKNYAEVIYAEHFNMPNNLCNTPIFPVKNGAAIKKCVSQAEAKMDIVCKNIKKGKIIKRGFNSFSHAIGLSQSSYWPAIEEKNKSSVKVHESCINCGLCVNLCPMKNLVQSPDGINHLNNCTLCYRCVNACPHQAITVLGHKKPKVQYKGIK